MATPTEIKAEEKATELIEFFNNKLATNLTLDTEFGVDKTAFEINKFCVICALKLCNETIEALSSVTGRGKIHKVKFWKLVKSNIDNYEG